MSDYDEIQNEGRDEMAENEPKLMMEDIIDAVAKVQGARENLGNVAMKFINVPGFGKMIWRKIAQAQVILEDLEGVLKRLPGRVKY